MYLANNIGDMMLAEERTSLSKAWSLLMLIPWSGGTQQSFIQGGFAPKYEPLPFYIPFFA